MVQNIDDVLQRGEQISGKGTSHADTSICVKKKNLCIMKLYLINCLYICF